MVSITTYDPEIEENLPPGLNIVTGEYILQFQRAKYNTNVVDPTCQLCQKKRRNIIAFPA